ncbi:uncharacterized protein BO87DRAFT_177652 [Aspergillus neoniger CBS 115656]|uniref:Uncharacterized protein n=1 Tax=Aspergillus neoniger (strain CBS 115656) TaxID=1448310 RepID=A0A318Y5Q4_ASPNB|nr:hypothetical protein BO87DRAFT_177652 [Aspergillus neoniger CBS 115656]PYH29595.1 hypothetical protein BO87DRAFT_177652 [Aspergillus neoniger CBS 115656]
MSLSRTSSVLRQCRLQLHPEFNSLTRTSPPLSYSTRHRRLSRYEAKSFHTTTPSYAAPRSPIARKAQSTRRQAVFTIDGVFAHTVQGDVEKMLQRLEKTVEEHYDRWKETHSYEGSYGRAKLSLDKYKQIAQSLLRTAYSQPPSARAIRAISTNVEVIWNVSRCLLSPDNRALEVWLHSACALAGARSPALMLAERNLDDAHPNYPLRTQFLDKVEQWALQERDPRAMHVYVRTLIARGEHESAVPFMDELMSTIYPSTRVEGLETPLSFYNIPQVWPTYIQLQEGLKKKGVNWGVSRDELARLAGVDYQEPNYLSSYASAMFEAGDYEKYEQYMHQAAMAGVPSACASLAHFYYLTARGLFPRRGEKTFVPRSEEDSGEVLKKGRLESLYSSIVRGLAPHEYYNNLALEWWELGLNMGSDLSAMFLALAYREAGQLEVADSFYKLVDTPRLWAPKFTADDLAINWDNPFASFSVPRRVLNVKWYDSDAKWTTEK